MTAWRAMKWVAAGSAALMLLSCAGGPFPLLGMTAIYTCFGWIGFLRRVVPQVAINWSGVATAVACLAVVVGGAHWLLRWLYANMPVPPAEHRQSRAWRPRWTACLTASVVLMFVSGICVVGAAHQTAWLTTSKEPLVTSTFESVYRSQSNNNLKRIGLGVLGYQERSHVLPAGATFDEKGRPQHGWQTFVLPFVEQKPLYDEIDLSVSWDDRQNVWAFRQVVPVYTHPRAGIHADARGYAASGYAGNAYLLGGARQWTLAEITDGTAKTILCGEATTQPRPWGDPVNWRDPAAGIGRTPNSFGGAFENVTQFVFVDGHTSAISNKIDPAVLRALGTPAAGDSIRATDDDSLDAR